ncbi:MAG: cysteine desulfurase family protein [Candidatus Sumerlaeia bacterium]|nr:cysteine desulfurase family protein [Candidatus Sumerlaeia bacterium]
MKHVYLDHNSTTPLLPEVLDTMIPLMADTWGNASSTHRYGIEARYVVERSRRTIESLIGAPDDSLVITSGGSEANNLAIRGVALEARQLGLGNHLLVGAAEHKAVLDTAMDLQARFGFQVTYLRPDAFGRARPGAVARALRGDTVLVALMLANNELGTINQVADIAQLVLERAPTARVHCDAVQAAGRIHVDVGRLRVDTLALSAHKMYGPKGVGGLYIRPGVQVARQIAGGGQERSLRAGTESPALAAGFARAFELAEDLRDGEAERLSRLREELWKMLSQLGPQIVRNSPAEGCLPGTLNVSLLGLDGRSVARELDAEGFAISAGSACTSEGEEVSHVMEAIGADPERARGAVRVSLGRQTTREEIEAFARAFRARVRMLASA